MDQRNQDKADATRYPEPDETVRYQDLNDSIAKFSQHVDASISKLSQGMEDGFRDLKAITHRPPPEADGATDPSTQNWKFIPDSWNVSPYISLGIILGS
jgi:hypothetical protein